MPVTSRNLVSPGLAVSIVLKADQRSGRLTQGIVGDVLTRSDHPRGIKVRLQDGQVGRVHGLTSSSYPTQRQKFESQSWSQPQAQLSSAPAYTIRTAKPKSRSKMSHNNNPWQEEESLSPSHNNNSNNPFNQQPAQAQHQESNPWGQQPSQAQHDAANYYQPPSNPPPSHTSQQQYSQVGRQGQDGFQPQGPHRTQTDNFLPQGQERSEQLETMQNYESRAPQSQEDKDQAQLQKEYPSVDSSLIAALYSDNKNVAEVREMLQELASGS